MRKLTNPRIIPVDGGNGVGKGTLIEIMRHKYTVRGHAVLVISSGFLYRAITKLANRKYGVDQTKVIPGADCVELAEKHGVELFGGEVHALGIPLSEADLKTPEIDQTVSAVAGHREVREFVNDRLIKQVNDFDGLVFMDGRDIGTVVFPEAPVKLFLTVSDEQAARRQGRTTEEVAERNAQDEAHEYGALKAHPDAFVCDTTDLTPEEVAAWADGVITDFFPEFKPK